MARAYNQAQKFGVEMAIPNEVIGLRPSDDPDDGRFVLKLSSDERATARSVVIASGVLYRRPAIADLDAFESASVHYWASPLEAKLCAGQEVALVGGGNAAGQAVVYLASQVAKVWLLVRRPDLTASMSRYLVDRITGLANVEIVTQAEVTGLEGDNGMLEAIRWSGGATDEEMRRPVRHLFLFTGADPNTHLLSESGIKMDAKRFVLTGRDAGGDRLPLETSRRGVFAIGDVRSGSVKRVAAAVGEGAQVVAALHTFLTEKGPNRRQPSRRTLETADTDDTRSLAGNGFSSASSRIFSRRIRDFRSTGSSCGFCVRGSFSRLSRPERLFNIALLPLAVRQRNCIEQSIPTCRRYHRPIDASVHS
jgi:thioredoxin reductase (NADPH)